MNFIIKYAIHRLLTWPVAGCIALSCQVTRKLKRATTFEFTTIPAIIFIHCCQQLWLNPC